MKLWDLAAGSCVLTFAEHQQPVWGVSWHWAGTLLASAGMDQSCKLWDVATGQNLSTLRGHTNSVNRARFFAFSNTLVTCSADKTVSLWDVRTVRPHLTMCSRY